MDGASISDRVQKIDWPLMKERVRLKSCVLVLNTWFESEELWSWRHVSQLLGLGKTFNKNVLLVLLKTMFRVLPPTIKPYYNLIRCRTGLIWVVNRAISRLFNSCFSNVVRQVACFSFWIFFFFARFSVPFTRTCLLCCVLQRYVSLFRYLRHVRSPTEGEKAGGYSSELACGRAIQEAFSALHLGVEL